MGQDAECYQVTPDDRTIIINARAFYAQPFVADYWTDLRCGFFLSVTDAVNDNLPNGAFAETIDDVGQGLPGQDHYSLGLIDTATGGTFIGFSNAFGPGPNFKGDSMLVSSDAGIGTTNTNFWRPKNGENDLHAATIFDGGRQRVAGPDGLQQHFPQIPANTGGYAVLLALQLLRANANSNTITVRIKSSAKSADMLYSNTPTKELIHQTMQTWPPSQQMGPVTLSHVPNAFYFYWPFRKTRLRVHSLGLLRPL